MLDQPQRWATLTDLGNIPLMKKALSSKQQTADRRVLNMKLKQKALTGKPQTKRFISSASILQSPAERPYPMEYTKDDSVRAGLNHYAIRKQLETRVRRARLDSGNLRQYSLKMFDAAIENYNNNDSKLNILNNTTKATMDNDSHKQIPPQTAVHNGPSHNGSLLYNKRGKILNSIRLRPKSEPVGRFNHEKGKTLPPEIQKTLCKSNYEFEVLSSAMPIHPCSPSTTSRSSSVSELKLVPRNESKSVSEISSINDFNTDGGVRVDVIDEMDEFLEVDGIESPKSVSESSDDLAFRMRNMPSRKIHYYSLEYDSSSEGSIPEPVPKPEVKPPPPPPTEEPKPKGRKGKQKGSAKKKKEPEPPPPPPPPEPEKKVEVPKVKKPLKGPKCWVDDATVTSEILEDRLENENVTDGERPVSAAKSVTIPEKCITNVNHVDNCDLQNIRGILSTPTKLCKEDDEHEEENMYDAYLPKYLCPSSERKSKQAAVKEWLATTNFRHAERCVPLL